MPSDNLKGIQETKHVNVLKDEVCKVSATIVGVSFKSGDRNPMYENASGFS